jgi:RES domain-containing protein
VIGASPATVAELAAAVAKGLPRAVVGKLVANAAPDDPNLRRRVASVPSALVPREANYLVNPAHPDTARLIIAEPQPLEWEARPFGNPPQA